jgi:hypothetical protein
MSGLNLTTLGRRRPALAENACAAVAEYTSRRQIYQIGNITGNGRQMARFFFYARGVAFQKGLGVRMGCSVKNIPYVPFFHNLTGIHDNDVVTKLCNQPQVMGNE